jgi:hypothetical protein
VHGPDLARRPRLPRSRLSLLVAVAAWTAAACVPFGSAPVFAMTTLSLGVMALGLGG